MSPSAGSASRWKIPFLTESVINKSDTFIPFISLSETWLKPYITDAQIDIPNYQVFRADRSKVIRGGSLLYIHKTLPVTEVACFENTVCSAVICCVEKSNTILASVYRPPNASFSTFSAVLDFIQSFIDPLLESKHYDVVLTGDFNLPNITWSSLTVQRTSTKENNESADLLLSFMNTNLMSQYINIPTRGSNILELLISNSDTFTHHVTSTNTDMSDHNIVKVTLPFNPAVSQPTSLAPDFEPNSFRALNLFKGDFDSINSELETIHWEYLKSLCNGIDEFSELFRLTILQICSKHCPPKEAGSKVVKSKEFRLRSVIKRKKRKLNSRLRAISQVNPKSPAIQCLKKKLSMLELELKESHIAELNAREKKAVGIVKDNPKYFYSYVKKFSRKRTSVGPLFNKENVLCPDPEVMADILQNQYKSVFSDPDPCHKILNGHGPKLTSELSNFTFSCDDIEKAIMEIDPYSACGEDDIPAFVLRQCKSCLSFPLYLIWSESLQHGHIPYIYKSQTITPVHKKDSRALPENYRPVSLTAHVIKVFERIIRNKLVEHLETNNLLYKHQHGFRKGRSCLTQLLAHIDNIMRNLLEGNDTDVVYLDYSKAFDKVDHEILLSKLKSYGIKGQLYTWIKSFLINRVQSVVVDGHYSYPAVVISGVPQGTVLGPILFLIYINDMNECISHSMLSSFADDTRLSMAISMSDDMTHLQADLNKTIEWSLANNMLLHEKKFDLLCHTTGKCDLLNNLPFMCEFYQYSTSKGPIEKQDLVRDLGVNIQAKLSWSPHINIIADDARKMASWVLSVFRDRSPTVMLTLYKSMVRSKLEFCCPLWDPSSVIDIQTLEAVQKTFTSRIYGCQHLSYWERLKHLKIQSLQRRRERYSIIHMWKILNNVSPNDINIQFSFSSYKGMKAKLPPLTRGSTVASQSIYDGSFAMRGPKLWNLLPREINTSTILVHFKSSLSRFLDQFPDTPPVRGYSPPNRNSLLEWAGSLGR